MSDLFLGTALGLVVAAGIWVAAAIHTKNLENDLRDTELQLLCERQHNDTFCNFRRVP